MVLYDAFTSDPHYGHKNIIKYCGRPFRSVEEQTETLIKNYNDRIGTKGRVLWLGDCFFGSSKMAREILSQLNGYKDVLMGNHDPDGLSGHHQMAGRGFDLVTDRMYFKWAGRNVTAVHYDQWNYRSPWDNRYESRRVKLNEGDILLHGHTHQKNKILLNQIHVGVDGWDFAPAMHDEVMELLFSVPDKFTKEFKEQEQNLYRYRELVKLDAQACSIGSDHLVEIDQEKYDVFRPLGWAGEWKEREK